MAIYASFWGGSLQRYGTISYLAQACARGLMPRAPACAGSGSDENFPSKRRHQGSGDRRTPPHGTRLRLRSPRHRESPMPGSRREREFVFDEKNPRPNAQAGGAGAAAGGRDGPRRGRLGTTSERGRAPPLARAKATPVMPVGTFALSSRRDAAGSPACAASRGHRVAPLDEKAVACSKTPMRRSRQAGGPGLRRGRGAVGTTSAWRAGTSPPGARMVGRRFHL